MIELTIPAIRSWAESLDESATVGTRKSECGCPLANYLRAQGAIAPHVNYDGINYRVNENHGIYVSSSEGVWRTIVTVVDYGHTTIPKYDPITRDQFLTMLSIAEEKVNAGITR